MVAPLLMKFIEITASYVDVARMEPEAAMAARSRQLLLRAPQKSSG
jgi:hypothetical protein